MSMFALILLLLMAVIVGNVFGRFFKAIPVPIFQILLGVIIALIFHTNLEIETDWFLLMFVAPLLFNDAWRFPRSQLWELRGPIFGNAIILVFVTTIIGGFLVNLMIPDLNLPLSFALVAILSPTDPIAVQAIARRFKLPDRILHIIAGESLINDVSGLVAFKYAIAAAVAGSSFSLASASFDFVYSLFGGALIGFLAMVIIDRGRDLIIKYAGNDSVLGTVSSLLLPFILYYLAENIFHASGLIAVVVGAITTRTNTDKSNYHSNEFFVVSEITWRSLAFAISGIVFVLMGISLPKALNLIVVDKQSEILELTLYAILIWVIVFLIRVIWTLINLYFQNRKTFKNKFVNHLKTSLVSGLVGVRGAVTLAGVLSLQSTDMSHLTEHELMLFVSTIVVLISLIVAAIALPLLTKKPINVAELDEIDSKISENDARIMTYYAGVAALREQIEIENSNDKKDDNLIAASYSLISEYLYLINQTKISSLSDSKLVNLTKTETKFRNLALDQEENQLQQLYQTKKISLQSYRFNLDTINQTRKSIGNSNFSLASFFKTIQKFFKRLSIALFLWISPKDTKKIETRNIQIFKLRYQAAINFLRNYQKNNKLTSVEQEVIANLTVRYKSRLTRLQANRALRKKYQERLEELKIISLNAERNKAIDLINSAKISKPVGAKLLEQINYGEISVLISSQE